MQENNPVPAPVATPEVVVAQQKNNNFLVILLSSLLIISVSISGFFAYQTQKLVKELTVLKTEEKIVAVATTEPTVEPVATNSVSATPDPTVNWKTYTWNGVSFKYPNTWFTSGSEQAPLFYIDKNTVDNPNYKMTIFNLVESSYKVMINDPVGTKKEVGDKIFEEKISDIVIDGQMAAKIKIDVLSGSATDARPAIVMRLIHNTKIFNLEIISPTIPESIIFDQILSTFKFTDAK